MDPEGILQVHAMSLRKHTASLEGRWRQELKHWKISTTILMAYFKKEL